MRVVAVAAVAGATVAAICVKKVRAQFQLQLQLAGSGNSDEMQIAADLCHKMAANDARKPTDVTQRGEEREGDSEKEKNYAGLRGLIECLVRNVGHGNCCCQLT